MKVLEDEQWLTLEACQGSIAAFETLVISNPANHYLFASR